jgi:hypothetical protein
MKRIASVIFLVGLTFGVRELAAQEFWYVPPGLDYGYRSGIDLGYGVGFGYGIGVGFKGNSGDFASAPSTIPHGENSGNTATSGPTNNSHKTSYDKTALLKQSHLKQQMKSERKEKAKADARLRNLRYFQYLESHAAALR